MPAEGEREKRAPEHEAAGHPASAKVIREVTDDPASVNRLPQPLSAHTTLPYTALQPRSEIGQCQNNDRAESRSSSHRNAPATVGPVVRAKSVDNPRCEESDEWSGPSTPHHSQIVPQHRPRHVKPRTWEHDLTGRWWLRSRNDRWGCCHSRRLARDCQTSPPSRSAAASGWLNELGRNAAFGKQPRND